MDLVFEDFLQKSGDLFSKVYCARFSNYCCRKSNYKKFAQCL